MQYDVVVLAELNPDVIVACDADVRFGQVEQLVERASVTLGSSGAITAAALAAQGLRVALCAVVGDDEPGRLATRMLAQRGVDITAVLRRPSVNTGMTVVLTRADGDRALLTFPGAMSALTAADVPSTLLADARHVHVSSFYLQRGLQAGLPELLRTAHRHGATTSIDPGWDPDEQWSAVGAVLPEVDHLLPNEAECLRIAAALGHPGDDAIAAARELAGRLAPAGSVAVKLGAAGAASVTGDAVTTVRGDMVAPVDTTGAGDSFDAGYLAAWLDGADAGTALARGAASGAISVTGFGGTGRLATRAEAVAGAAGLLVRPPSNRPTPHPIEETA